MLALAGIQVQLRGVTGIPDALAGVLGLSIFG